MGACTFGRRGCGKTDKEAYEDARRDAGYENGHIYSGDLGSKDGYLLTTPPAGINPMEWMRMIEDFDPDTADPKHKAQLQRLFNVYEDKYDRALCIKLEEGQYIFFGWAPM